MREIEKLIAQAQYRSSESTRERIRSHIDEAWQNHMPGQAGASVPRGGGRSIISRSSKLAIAALLLLVTGLFISLLNKSAHPAYAIEDTARALENIRYFHFRFVTASGNPDREAWVEYDPNDSIKNVRVDFHNYDAVMVWSENATQYWRRKMNQLRIFDDREYTDKILFFVRRYDPKQAIGYLQKKEGVRIDVRQPFDGADPITVTVTYEPNTFVIGSPKLGMRELFHIDPSTKLVTAVEVHYLHEGRYLETGVWEYIDYNQPFEPSIFDLRSEAPHDVSCSDTTAIDMGVEQDQLSNDDVAVEVVREFLDAWVSRDYDRAAKIHGYMDPEEQNNVHRMLREKDLTRVLSIGTPTSPQRPAAGGLLVPCVVEFEKDGRIESEHIEFRVSEGAKGRWRIRDHHTGA
jgi:hypothetical protein